MATVDVTVRGAGILGLSVAWACLRAGARVRVVDPSGVAAGASGGIVGALAPHTPDRWNAKKAFQLASLLEAGAFWRAVDAASGLRSGYARCGRVQPLQDERAVQLARERAGAARDRWGDAADWRVSGEAAGGWRLASPTGLFLHDTLSARLHPRRACLSLASALRAGGAEIVAQAPDAGAVLWATGVAGLGALSAGRSRPAGGGVKGQAALLRCAMAGRPQLFVQGLHVVPHDDGTVAIGSTSERDFAAPGTTDAQLDALIAQARGLVSELADAPVIARWAGVRPRARSRAPMLGPWPSRPGHFVANGGFKIGFGVAPGVARAMAALMLQGRDEIPAEFRVEASF